jgi:8-oxo-dGTP diphosphatase
MTVSLTGERRAVHDLVGGIQPYDEREAADRSDALDWIAGDADIYRRVAPADPPKHLVTYFLPYHAETDAVFLVAHRKAGRWLPPGGHVEPGEGPWTTVVREAEEELKVVARPHPLWPGKRPLFISVTQTVGQRSHTDVTLFYLLALDPRQPVTADPGEFSDWGWFPRTEVAAWPAGRTDPEFGRFLAKLDRQRAGRNLQEPR